MFGTSTVRRLGFSLALGLVLPSLMAAQGASPASGSATAKIGIVNMEEAIVTCNEGKKELDALQQRFEPKRATLKTLNDEIEGLKQQLQSQGPKLSDDERTTRERTIQTKQTTLQRNFDDAQAEFQQAQQDVGNKIFQKMRTVLEKYATKNGFSIVLDSSSQQNPVLWAVQGVVITKDLVDAYNTESPATPTAATGGSSSGGAASGTGTAAKKP
ncbi:MAG TPA: OmpH family outer membrane protein [Candidatus Angelobacter sp.]|nr:OmpH family outer membrane protein [Candidatus Angelobacter sp.]